MKLISHRYIYARTIEHKKNYKRGLKLTVNPNYLNKYLKKKERKEKEQERGTKVSTVSKTLYTSIHGQKMEKKKKKKNSRFPTGCFTFHGSIGAKSRSVRDRPWFKRNTDLTLPGYARSACVLLHSRSRFKNTQLHSSGSVFTYIRVHARTPADINCRCIYICARHLERLPCHAIFHDPATPRRMTNHYLCFPSALSPESHFPYEMIS